MQIEGRQPEVEQRPREPRARGDGQGSCAADEAIGNYIAYGAHDPWTVVVARRIFEEDAEFLEMLGDR
jgi:hypothetical protein